MSDWTGAVEDRWLERFRERSDDCGDRDKGAAAGAADEVKDTDSTTTLCAISDAP